MGREATLPWIQRVCSVEANAIHGVAKRLPPARRNSRRIPDLAAPFLHFPGDWIQLGRVLAHANFEWGAPLRRLRSRLVLDERGGVTSEPLR
jgi:hypothetical protein